jgi:hypothetical protein
MKNILLLCIALLLVVAGFQQAEAQEKGLAIELAPPLAGDSLFVWVPAGPYGFKHGETITLSNKSGFDVVMSTRNQSLNPLEVHAISNGASWGFVMNNDSARFIAYTYIHDILVDSVPPDTIWRGANQVLRGPSPTPTLSQWGLISLLVLILASGVIVAMRKRTAVA